MADSNLTPRLLSVAAKLRADFEASANTQHHGSRVTEREEIFANFIRLYLPRSAEIVHNAEIIAANGEVSPQCDVIIIDKDTPILQDLKSHRIIPAECVYGVIEIKSRLTGPELEDACEKIKKIKKLARDAFYRDKSCEVTMGGRTYPIMPIFGLVFGYDSITPEKLGATLAEWCRKNPVETHPDSVWILDKGNFTWASIGGAGILLSSVLETSHRELRLYVPAKPGEMMLAFIMRISIMIENVRLPRVQIGKYFYNPPILYALGGTWQIQGPA